MKKKADIRTYTLEELAKLPSKTNWAKVQATTQQELERAIAEDPNERDLTPQRETLERRPEFRRADGGSGRTQPTTALEVCLPASLRLYLLGFRNNAFTKLLHLVFQL